MSVIFRSHKLHVSELKSEMKTGIIEKYCLKGKCNKQYVFVQPTYLPLGLSTSFMMQQINIHRLPLPNFKNKNLILLRYKAYKSQVELWQPRSILCTINWAMYPAYKEETSQWDSRGQGWEACVLQQSPVQGPVSEVEVQHVQLTWTNNIMTLVVML